MLAVVNDTACPRCGWWADANGACRRETDTRETCDLYAFSDAITVDEARGWNAPSVAELVSTRAPEALRPVPATVWAKRADVVGGYKLKVTALAKMARYRPAVAPTFPAPWSEAERAALGTVEHSAEWLEWYRAMPAKMTAKQEREYFLRGPVK